MSLSSRAIRPTALLHSSEESEHFVKIIKFVKYVLD